MQSQDNVRKNYYLYRDPAGPLGWVVLPWDLDLSFGHLYTEAGGVLDEAITIDGDPFVGALAAGATGQYNVLVDRLLTIPELRARFLALTRRIADAEAAHGLVAGRLTWAVCRAMPDLLADERKRADNAEYLGRVVAGRRAVLADVP
jgi:hypothetical protein